MACLNLYIKKFKHERLTETVVGYETVTRKIYLMNVHACYWSIRDPAGLFEDLYRLSVE